MLQRRDNASTTHTIFVLIIFFLSVVVVLASCFTFRYFRRTSRLAHSLDSQQQWEIPPAGPKGGQAEYLVYGPVFAFDDNPKSSLSNMSSAEKGEDPSQRVNAYDHAASITQLPPAHIPTFLLYRPM